MVVVLECSETGRSIKRDVVAAAGPRATGRYRRVEVCIAQRTNVRFPLGRTWCRSGDEAFRERAIAFDRAYGDRYPA